MIVLVVNFEVKEGKKKEFLDVMDLLIDGSQKEEGCIMYEMYEDVENLNAFVLLEKWLDQAALDFHNTTDHFVAGFPKIQELCDKIALGKFN